MAKLFRPDADRLRLLGFGSVARVPVLFDGAGRYCRALNRYLRHRALGEAKNESVAPWDDEEIPMSRTIENVGRHLGVFQDWCDNRDLDWHRIPYQGVLRFQNEMASGRWSLSGRTLDARTCNLRADEATNFLIWAAKVGLRPSFKVRYKLKRRHPDAGSLSGQEYVKSRRGRLTESDTRDVEEVSFLPQPKLVADWLQAVRTTKGYAKYLASRFVIEAGTRRMETVAVTVDQIPSRELLERLASEGQAMAPVTLVVTKGGKPRTILLAIAFLMEIRAWIDGPRMRLRYLWHKREKTPPSPRLFLSDARDYEGTPVSEARLYDCFHTVTPRPTRWHTHFGRHSYACFYVLFALEHEAKAAKSSLRGMGADWIMSRGSWYLKTLRKQLGHVSESTTDLYLRWLVTAAGLSAAAAGWHSFLADGVEADEVT